METTKILSDRQRAMLTFIPAFTKKYGYPPSIRDIGNELSISSTSVVTYNLKILEREGLIKRDETVSRGLCVVGDTPASDNGAYPSLDHLQANDIRQSINHNFPYALAILQKSEDGWLVLVTGR